MKTFGVKIPITGHLYLEVEAEDEESAVELAYDISTIDDVEAWDATLSLAKAEEL